MFPQLFLRRMSLILIGVLFCSLFSVPATLAKTKDEKDAARAAKVKAAVAKLGTGPNARIAVKLRDKTTVTGYISQVGDDSFVVTDLKTSATTTVPYFNVEQARGKGLSTGAKIAIGAGVGVGALFLIWFITCMKNGDCDA